MNKQQMRSQSLFNSCLVLTIIVVVMFWAMGQGNKVSERYEKEGIDVVVTVENIVRFRKHTSVYGSYIYNNYKYENVEVINSPFSNVGDRVECKVLPEKPFSAHYMGTEADIAKNVIYFILIIIAITDVWCIYGYFKFKDVMRNGFVETGIVKSVDVEEGKVYAKVEFEDHRGNVHLVNIFFEKKLVMEGQKCTIKYKLRSDGKADAFYYDVRG